MYKVCETCKFFGLVLLFPLLMILYVYLTMAKFQVGDCIKFDYGKPKVYKVTKSYTFRYVLDNKVIISRHATDKQAKKVKCSVK